MEESIARHEKEIDPETTAPTKGGISLVWRAMRHRNFRLFFGGQSISLIGTWMTRIATAWLVYRLTGSAWLLGIVGFCRTDSNVSAGPFRGRMGGPARTGRHVLLVTQTLAMVQSLALAALTLTPSSSRSGKFWG